MRKKKYPSDVSRVQFEQIRPLLEGVRRRTKRRTVHSYFAKWSEPDQDGVSVLERALKKTRWRGPYQTGTQRHDELLDRIRPAKHTVDVGVCLGIDYRVL